MMPFKNQNLGAIKPAKILKTIFKSNVEEGKMKIF